MRDAAVRDIQVRSGSFRLAGTLSNPVESPIATLLMHPGSGPSTRDNDVYFPEIRAHLLRSGIAVASFDKRGVGGSTGDWRDAGIVEQADDVAAAGDALIGEGVTSPLGVFGHSQGGWVVIEAASRGAPVAFVISNSGPGVTAGVQDRFSLGNVARRAGLKSSDVDELLHGFDVVVALLRSGASLAEARTRLGALGLDGEPSPISFLADDEREWNLAGLILEHDPVPAMRSIGVPLLALFGADDEVVPVDESVRSFRSNVHPQLLSIAVLAGGDHRVQGGNPKRLVDGYARTLVRFISSCSRT
ncbi:MAG: alpha/beta hydrolase [Acidimicrobiales bacterium]